MKLKILQILTAFAIVIWLFNFASAQSKPVAVKFDEFDEIADKYFYAYYKPITADERTERFIKQLKKEKQVKAYIIYYKARITIGYDDNRESSSFASSTSYEITSKTKLSSEDVIEIDGGYREKNTVEYWIVPKNAEPPKPTPSFDKAEAIVCPNINVYSYGLNFEQAKTIDFSVWSNDFKLPEKFKFIWNVTSGEIVDGQGTDKITVKLNDKDSKRITAFVEISGLPKICANGGVATLEVGNKPYLYIESSRYNVSELSARIDDFMVTLNSYPTYKGYIIVYGDRKTGGRSIAKATSDIKKSFFFRKYDLERITIVAGGYRENNAVEMWILPIGSELPQPTPTVDEKFVVSVEKVKQNKLRKRK